MPKEKVLVYSTNKSYQAGLLKNILNDNDIPSFIIDKQDSAYLFGDVEVYVYADDFLRAKSLTEKFEET